MKLPHTAARLAALIAIAAGVLGAFGARAALADPTVTLAISPNPVAVGTQVTFTTTVSSTSFDPAGTISISASQLGAPIASGQVLLPFGTNTRSVSVGSSTLPAGSYSVKAVYTPDFLSLCAILNVCDSVSSAVQTLTVGTGSLPSYTTGITLVAPSSITSTDSFDLVATVARTGAGAGSGTPTGTVTFSDTSSGTAVPLITDPSHPNASTVQLVNGQATLHVANGLAPGHYSIVASYQPDAADGSDNPSQMAQAWSLQSNAPVDTVVSTTTTVVVSPTTIASGDTVNITATVTQSGLALGPSSGDISFTAESSGGSTAAVLTSSSLTLSPTTHSVTIVATGWQVGSYTIHASYVGNSFDHGSTGSAPLTVLPARSAPTINYTGPTTGEYGHPTTLSATVFDGTTPAPAGTSVTFTLGAQSCTTTTDSTGAASCPIASITATPGPAHVTVSVATDLHTSGATLNVNYTVSPQATTTSVAAQTNGATTTLTATLKTDLGTPLQIAGDPATVTFTLGSATCTATTTSSVATCSVPTPTGTTTATLAATLANGVNFTGSSDSKTVTLLPTATLSYTGTTAADYHDLAVLSAKLVDANGAPLAHQWVTFTLGTQICTVLTDSHGVATTVMLMLQNAGTYQLTVDFAGNASYPASHVSAPFTVTPEETKIASLVAGPVLDDNSIELSALLLEDGLFPIPNRTVTLSLGAAHCTATTNWLGLATCTVGHIATLGPTTSSASFAGDQNYESSTASTSALLYAHGPGGGSFVVGDHDADGSVYFWGSQWSKRNSMSGGGGSSSSFKGYANHGVTSCGKNWSADPGNSSTPPSGALPAYMDVVVASSSSKSGSSIAGNSVHIVIVKTDAGYAGNPGHDGTGTVVATLS